MAEVDYRVSLDKFEGPLDLLLYLIRREEVDIYDIPISNITDQYMQYVELMKDLNLEMAGEFMVMASTLMEIKSKMLLPGETLEDDDELDDPRLSLVKQLLEYRKFKTRTNLLKDKFNNQMLRHARPGSAQVPDQEPVFDLGEIGLFDLFTAYKNIIQDIAPAQTTIHGDETSAEEHMYSIVELIKEKKTLLFRDLFPPGASRVYLAGVFLGILELVRQKKLLAYQGNRESEIRVTSPEYHRDTITDVEGFNRFKDKRVTVFGLGAFNGGLSLTRYLAEHNATVTVSDQKSADDLAESVNGLSDVDVTFHLGEHKEEDFKNADIVFVNPAIKPDAPEIKIAEENDVELDTGINYFLRHTPADIIGVTGSNGKSTTTTLLGEMIKSEDAEVLVAGNIGEPYLQRLDYLTVDNTAVLELSSFQLSRVPWIGISPKIAVITNVTPNHLDWHKTNTEYQKAKFNILRYQGESDIAVLNYDDKLLREWAERCPGKVAFFSSTQVIEGYCVVDDYIVKRTDGKETRIANINKFAPPGKHNLANLCAAAAAADQYDIPAKNIQSVINSYENLEHRHQLVAVKNDIEFINDSKSTTPEALAAACDAYEGNIILLAGGYDKGADFKHVGEKAAASLKGAVLYGETSRKIGRAIKKPMETRDSSLGKALHYTENLQEAFDMACSMASPGDVILLSPGSASFGEFKNYEDRGQAFTRMVESYQPPTQEQ